MGNKYSEHGQYNCSNPNCDKVFSKPKIIKYYVCPSCQTLIDQTTEEGVLFHPSLEGDISTKKLEKSKVIKQTDKEVVVDRTDLKEPDLCEADKNKHEKPIDRGQVKKQSISEVKEPTNAALSESNKSEPEKPIENEQVNIQAVTEVKESIDPILTEANRIIRLAKALGWRSANETELTELSLSEANKNEHEKPIVNKQINKQSIIEVAKSTEPIFNEAKKDEPDNLFVNDQMVKQTITEAAEPIEPTLIQNSQSVIVEEEKEKADPDSTDKCSYYFGYLNQRTKGETIPEKCVECPKSIECLMSEVDNSKESLKEIKKWYI